LASAIACGCRRASDAEGVAGANERLRATPVAGDPQSAGSRTNGGDLPRAGVGELLTREAIERLQKKAAPSFAAGLPFYLCEDEKNFFLQKGASFVPHCICFMRNPDEPESDAAIAAVLRLKHVEYTKILTTEVHHEGLPSGPAGVVTARIALPPPIVGDAWTLEKGLAEGRLTAEIWLVPADTPLTGIFEAKPLSNALRLKAR
jgi:hypothetical protein